MTDLNWLNATVESSMLAVCLLIVGIVVVRSRAQIANFAKAKAPDLLAADSHLRLASKGAGLVGILFVVFGSTLSVFVIIRILTRVLPFP